MRIRPAVFVALAFLLVPSALLAQSLGEAAAKEKQRRKAVKDAKAFTEDDLRRAGAGYTPTPVEETLATAEVPPKEGEAVKKEATEEKSEEELHAEASAAWRKRLEQAQESVKKLQADIEKIQFDLNDTSAGFYGARRTTLLNFLEDTKKKLADAQQQVANLEDEGRKNNYR